MAYGARLAGAHTSRDDRHGCRVGQPGASELMMVTNDSNVKYGSATSTNVVAPGHRTYHLTTLDEWTYQHRQPMYRAATLDGEGFIHCTDLIDELIAVGNRYYRDDLRTYVALQIDCDRVSAPIVYDDPTSIFPHVYGPMDIEAVIRVFRVERDSAGTFLKIVL
ncbi:hypothetical protein BH23CHL5_BH23CHL5_06190 [soil metagenome]